MSQLRTSSSAGIAEAGDSLATAPTPVQAPAPALVHGGTVVAAQLAQLGIGHLFTLTGGHLSPLFDGCDRAGVRLVDFRHEQAAAHAADAMARLTRQVQASAATAGPGVAGAAVAVANAWSAGSPLMLLCGRNPIATDGMGALQEAPQLDMLKPVTRVAALPLDAWRLPSVIAEAAAAAMVPRPAPVAIDLPFDLLMTRMPADQVALAGGRGQSHGPGADPDAVAKTAALLRAARAPLILVGSGVYWAGAEAALDRLTRETGCPVFANGAARGILPPDHPAMIASDRARALPRADLVLAIGVDFDFRLNYGQPPLFHPDAVVVHVDADPSRLGRNRGAVMGITACPRRFVTALAEAFEAGGHRAPGDWLQGLKARDVRAATARAARLVDEDGIIDHARFAAEAARFADVDADTVTIGDGGDVIAETAGAIQVGRPGHWLDPGPFGCLGVGLPFAMAARLARPQAPVLAVMGDGAFGFNAMEIDSAVRQRLGFVVLIGNDGAWGEMRNFHADIFGDRCLDAQSLSRHARYDRLAEALGGHGERVERARDIRPALERARRAAEQGVPAIVDVMLDPAARRPAGAVSGAAVAAAFGGGDPSAFKS
ncbi:thiamine pyrophosphate-binding protein [Tistrella bauzanensis]|nr:thiamine pyrophosphate-binding protein [Tistrella bauzanensis]